MPKNRMKSRFLPFWNINEPRHRAILRRGFQRFMGFAAVCDVVIVKRLGQSLNHSGNR